MEDWLAMFTRDVVKHLDAPRQQEIFHAVAERLRPTHYRDGAWTLDYRRLRIVAQRCATLKP